MIQIVIFIAYGIMHIGNCNICLSFPSNITRVYVKLWCIKEKKCINKRNIKDSILFVKHVTRRFVVATCMMTADYMFPPKFDLHT